jgi:hypothetical protein
LDTIRNVAAPPFLNRTRAPIPGLQPSPGYLPVHNAPGPLGSTFPLSSVFFIDDEKSRCVSVGLYPAQDYKIKVEFGGSRIQSKNLTGLHVKTLAEHFSEIYDAMYLGKRYNYKDDEFKLECSGNDSSARMYLTSDSLLLMAAMYVI